MESLVTQTALAYSTAPESAYGVNPVIAADYTSFLTRAAEQPVPDTEKTDDRGDIGRGNAMYPSTQRTGFAIPTSFDITNIVDVGSLQPLVRRYMGKTSAAPSVVEASIAFKHILREADPDVEGLQLPSTSFVYQNNEFDYLLPGGVGSTFQVAQAGTQDPNFTLGIVTSGNRKRISEDYPAFGSLGVPSIPPRMYGTSSNVQFTDDVAATVNLTTPEHKLRGETFTANNALITDDTRQGMPQIDTTEPRLGWYRDFLHYGDREQGAEFTTGMDGDYSLKSAQELNLIYTNWTWTMRGDKIPTTATNNKYEFKIIIPKFYLRLPRSGNEGAKKTKTFTIFPVVHAAYYGLYSIEIVNGIATAVN